MFLLHQFYAKLNYKWIPHLEKEIPVYYYPRKGGTVRGNCSNGNLLPITVIYRGNSKINGDFLGGKLPGNVGNIFFLVIYVIC